MKKGNCWQIQDPCPDRVDSCKNSWSVSTAVTITLQSSQVLKIFRNCSTSSTHFLSFGLITPTNDNAFHNFIPLIISTINMYLPYLKCLSCWHTDQQNGDGWCILFSCLLHLIQPNNKQLGQYVEPD